MNRLQLKTVEFNKTRSVYMIAGVVTMWVGACGAWGFFQGTFVAGLVLYLDTTIDSLAERATGTAIEKPE